MAINPNAVDYNFNQHRKNMFFIVDSDNLENVQDNLYGFILNKDFCLSRKISEVNCALDGLYIRVERERERERERRFASHKTVKVLGVFICTKIKNILQSVIHLLILQIT